VSENEKKSESPKEEPPKVPPVEKNSEASQEARPEEAPVEEAKPELNDEVLEDLMRRFPEAVDGHVPRAGRVVMTVKRERLGDVCRYLKETKGTDHLSCLSGADYEDRLEVVYHLGSPSFGTIYTLKVPLPKEDPTVESVTSLWGSADWHEREAYDLYGIRFEGHPNLTRILNPDGFEGFPFRKEWKLVANPWYEGKEVPGEGEGKE
jgi:NADH-quinone oxidoreductase subunit C